jgi:lysophospholipase L1-like esterase
MKIIRVALLLTLAMSFGGMAQTPPPATPSPTAPTQQQLDWANVAKYHDANAHLAPPAAGEKRVVFFGDSITEAWAGDPNFFPGKSYIGRGISGQTTAQMLIRFQSDVVDLHPAVVVILAGTNDIAENNGPITLEAIEANLETMAKLARANGIKPILCSVLPAFDYPWHPGLHPDQKIPKLNTLIKAYCAKNHVAYLDYFPALVDARQGMRADLSKDGVHPNSAGYAVMVPMAEKAIAGR